MTLRAALVGNPNCGKTTLFNKLTGASQRVGNWPGVTIDRKSGKIKGISGAELIDTPGIYSLSPYSPEEIVARDFLMNDRPDVVINIVDATNLERNLFLTLQVLDTGIPTVVALNMMDSVRKEGGEVDVDRLSRAIGHPVVPISALRSERITELVDAAVAAASEGTQNDFVPMDHRVEELIQSASEALGGKVPDEALRWYSVKLIENDPVVCGKFREVRQALAGEIASMEKECGDDIDSIISDARYRAIAGLVKGVIIWPEGKDTEITLSDRVDRIVTHRYYGIPIFICIWGALFLGIIGFGDHPGIGTYFTDLIDGWLEDSLKPAVVQWCADNQVSDPLTGLLTSAFIGGVGAVISFLPQILFLFLALCILEDVGYMARIAYVMDPIFRSFGLSGKSLIPVMVGTGCGVPGVMSSRTIENDRDRTITAMTVTFIPCGAKLPVIALIAGALFGNNGLVAIYSYLLGIAVILMSGVILKKWKGLAGKPAPFIMELSPYHMPSAGNVLKSTADRGWAFVKNAGTIILIAAVAIWFLASYSPSLHYIGNDAAVDSILQSIGQVICVVFQPLGWGDHWEMTVGTIAGLAAKENIVGILGTLFSMEDAGDAGEGYWAILASMLTPAAGLGFLTFNLLCAPCVAAIGAMRRELGSWRATGRAVGYQFAMAYAVASIVYVVMSFVMGSTPVVSGIIICIVSAVILTYLVFARDPFMYSRREEASA